MSALKERLILGASNFTAGQAPLADVFNECASVIQLAEALAMRTLAYVEPLNADLECDVELHELATVLLAKIGGDA
jgi:hypothetical protein